jgi:hypothetical protein
MEIWNLEGNDHICSLHMHSVKSYLMIPFAVVNSSMGSIWAPSLVMGFIEFSLMDWLVCCLVARIEEQNGRLLYMH